MKSKLNHYPDYLLAQIERLHPRSPKIRPHGRLLRRRRPLIFQISTKTTSDLLRILQIRAAKGKILPGPSNPPLQPSPPRIPSRVKRTNIDDHSEEMEVTQTKSLEVSVDESGERTVRLKTGDETEGIEVRSTIGLEADTDGYFKKLFQLHHEYIPRPLTYVRNINGTSECAIYYKKPLCLLDELGEKIGEELFIDAPHGTSEMSNILKRIFFNIGVGLSYLHLGSWYHGDLRMKNIWLYKEGNEIIPKLHGIKGLVNNSTLKIDFEERKKVDFDSIRTLVLAVFYHYDKIPSQKIHCFVNYLQNEKTENSYLCNSYWWTYEQKKSRILRMQLCYDYRFGAAANIKLPQRLKSLLDCFAADRKESRYTHDVSSLVLMLMNKLFHPEMPEFENNFENLLNYVEECWPDMWMELEKHKIDFQPPQIVPHNGDAKLLSKRQQKNLKK